MLTSTILSLFHPLFVFALFPFLKQYTVILLWLPVKPDTASSVSAARGSIMSEASKHYFPHPRARSALHRQLCEAVEPLAPVTRLATQFALFLKAEGEQWTDRIQLFCW